MAPINIGVVEYSERWGLRDVTTRRPPDQRRILLWLSRHAHHCRPWILGDEGSRICMELPASHHNDGWVSLVEIFIFLFLFFAQEKKLVQNIWLL
jgi:hypothetical protein